jgi:hypothetical protein
MNLAAMLNRMTIVPNRREMILGQVGGLSAIASMYPNLTERHVYNIAAGAKNVKNLHALLNKESNRVRNFLLGKTEDSNLSRNYMYGLIRANLVLANAGGMPILGRDYPNIPRNKIHNLSRRFKTSKEFRKHLDSISIKKKKKKPVKKLPAGISLNQLLGQIKLKD